MIVPTLIAEKLRHVSPFVYKLGAQAWIDHQFPRHLFLETTAACNLACEYCPRERRGQHMDFKLFQQAIDEATRYGPRSFSLHLFGEPLLYPRLLEAIDYIKRQNSHHVVLLTTNGTYLERFIDDLIRLQVDKIIWTWRPEASFTPSTKEKLRRWGHFMVRLIEEITPANAMEEWEMWQPQERKKLHNYGGNINTSLYQDLNHQLVGFVEKRWPCYHLWLAPAVAWNGKLLICCADPHQEEVLGQFPHMSIHEAWTSPRLAAIRESHLRAEYGGICTTCDVWKTYPDIWFNFQKKAHS